MMTCFYQASAAWQTVLLVISQFAVIALAAGTIVLFKRKCKLTKQKLPLYEQQPVRSEWEDCLLKKAYELDIPVLGACRGHQMITVALGGSLDKDFYPPHRQTQPYHEGHHTVKIAEGSLLDKLAGTEDWFVNSIHTQKVETAPPGFIISARTEDGSAEAVESTEKTFFLGTQFHPELMPENPRSQAIFRGFIAAAAALRQSI